ncbi:MAG: hypothetical protein ACKO2G_07595 [Verrucomicrobiales bacterium]
MRTAFMENGSRGGGVGKAVLFGVEWRLRWREPGEWEPGLLGPVNWPCPALAGRTRERKRSGGIT